MNRTSLQLLFPYQPRAEKNLRALRILGDTLLKKRLLLRFAAVEPLPATGQELSKKFNICLLSLASQNQNTMKRNSTLSTLFVSLLLAFSSVVAQNTNCPAPLNPTTTSVGTNSAVLNWTAPSGVQFYYVQWRPVTNPPSNYTQVIAQVPVYTLGNLQCNTAYEWRVQSVCSGSGIIITSPYAGPLTFTTLSCGGTVCPAPTNLSATNITANSAVLSWTGVSLPATYNLRYRTQSTAAWTTVNGVSSPYQFGNLTCNTTYEWQVQSVCANTTGTTTLSPWSASAFFTTLPCSVNCPAPTGLSVTNITSNSAMLSWNAVTGAVSYQVRYRPSSTTTWSYLTSISPAITISGLICNKAYVWQVRSICTPSSNTSTSVFSALHTFVTAACPSVCQTPTGLTASNITATSALLSWIATNATSYNVRYRISGTTTWTNLNTSGTSVTISSLQPASAYEWQVQGVCLSTNATTALSLWSASAFFQTLSANNLCSAPVNLSVTGVSQQGALLNWSAVPNALAYNIRYRNTNSTAWVNTTSSANFKQIGGLQPGQAYVWQVQAVCSNLNGVTVLSPWSVLHTFTTPLLALVNPNPADRNTVLNFIADKEEMVSIEVCDIIGNLLIIKPFTASINSNEVTLSTESLKDGIYYVKIISAAGIQSVRFVVKH